MKEKRHPWFLHAEPEEASPLPRAPAGGLIEAGEWRLAEAALAANLAALAFDAGRLAERLAGSGPGAVQRLAQRDKHDVNFEMVGCLVVYPLFVGYNIAALCSKRGVE